MRNSNIVCDTATSTVISARVSDFVNQFTCFANKSAEAVLDMCRVVHRAKTELKRDEFDSFVREINLKPDSGTISKWKKIGENYDRLVTHKDKLPASWTTLYNLCNLSDDKLVEGITNHLIHETMTNQELKKVDPNVFPSRVSEKKSSPPSSTSSLVDYLYTIKATVNFDQQKQAGLLDELKQLCQKYDCEFTPQGEMNHA